MPERGIAIKSMPMRGISQKMAKGHPRTGHYNFKVVTITRFKKSKNLEQTNQNG